MAARTKTKEMPKYKTKYRVKNWAVYDVDLRDRGEYHRLVRRGGERCLERAPPSGRPVAAQVFRHRDRGSANDPHGHLARSPNAR